MTKSSLLIALLLSFTSSAVHAGMDLEFTMDKETATLTTVNRGSVEMTCEPILINGIIGDKNGHGYYSSGVKKFTLPPGQTQESRNDWWLPAGKPYQAMGFHKLDCYESWNGIQKPFGSRVKYVNDTWLEDQGNGGSKLRNGVRIENYGSTDLQCNYSVFLIESGKKNPEDVHVLGPVHSRIDKALGFSSPGTSLYVLQDHLPELETDYCYDGSLNLRCSEQ